MCHQKSAKIHCFAAQMTGLSKYNTVLYQIIHEKQDKLFSAIL